MDTQRKLYAGRLREGLEQIAQIRESKETAHSRVFKAWRDRVEQSLRLLFGSNHDYTERFTHLGFWIIRVSPIGAGLPWAREDQDRFDQDLHLGEQILTDALEELEFIPQPAEEQRGRERGRPPIVVNVTNVLSQTTAVNLSQVLADLGQLGLSPEDQDAVERHANELAAEARGGQRWPMLAKSLDAIRKFGKPVYERVAIPLLLEMLKKQAGL